jgi:hypothetical protein
VVDSVENAHQTVRQPDEHVVQSESATHRPQLGSLGGAHGGDEVGKGQSALQEIHLAVPLELSPVVQLDREPQLEQRFGSELALVSGVVDRKDGERVPDPRLIRQHGPQDADEEQGGDRPMEPDPVQTGENIDQDQKARNCEGRGNRARQVRQPVRDEALPRGCVVSVANSSSAGVRRRNGFRPGKGAFVSRQTGSSVGSAAHRHAIAGHGSNVLHRLLAETVEADG